MKHLLIGGIAALAIGLTGCSSTTSASGPSSTNTTVMSTPVTISVPKDWSTIPADGTYEIGGFINLYPAGTWEVNGGLVDDCVWVLRSSPYPDPPEPNVISRGRAHKDEPVRLMMDNGDYLTTTGCDTWKFVG